MADAEARRRSLVVGVAGGSGSGKSTVAHALVRAFDESTAVVIDCDAYYRDFSHMSAGERSAVNWDHPDSLDLERLAADLSRLAGGEAICKPLYDFVTHRRRAEVEKIAPRNVIVAEGILLFADRRVRDLCDIRVFVDADADLRLIRRLQRDMQERGRPLEEILHQYLTTVRPMHLEFVEPGKRYADVIVPQGGHNEVAIDMLIAHVQLYLQHRGRS
jgi:uridine kinase